MLNNNEGTLTVMNHPETTEIAPRVDVGIPTKGGRRYLVEAVESVVGQSFDHWQLVVSENGPGDESVAELLRPYLSDPRVRHIKTGEAVSAARNSTIAASAGTAPYVAVLHDDDRWEPEFLARRVDLLERNPSCGFVFSGYVEIDANGAEIRRSPIVLPEGVHPSDQFVRFLLAPHGRPVAPGGIPAPTVLMRRSAYEAVGPAFDERFSSFFDWEMWLRLGIRFPVGYLGVRDAHFRIHPMQMHRAVRQFGEEKLHLWPHVDELIDRELPGARLGEEDRAWRRSGALLTAALDALEEGDRRRCFTRLAEAVRIRPRSLLDPRVPALLACLPFGARARRVLRPGRLRMHDRYLRLPP
jgi:glycosyltransferase involved in cell wall biosynthesis